MKLRQIIEAVDRRQFLRTMGAASSAAGLNPLQALGALGRVGKAVNKFTKMSDGQLMTSPELGFTYKNGRKVEGWVSQIPKARFLQIVQDNPEYIQSELVNKLHSAVNYGADYRQAQDVFKILADAGEQVGLDVQDLFTTGVANLYKILPDFAFGGQQTAWINKFAAKSGLKLDKSNINKLARSEHSADITNKQRTKDLEQERADRAEKTKKLKPEQIDPPPDYALASPMHQPFEQKLNAALKKLII